MVIDVIICALDFNRFIDKFRQICRENKIDYVLLDTMESFDKALFEYLAKRNRLG